MATFSLVLAFTNFRPGPTMFLLRGCHDLRVGSRDDGGTVRGNTVWAKRDLETDRNDVENCGF
jgi:hypothetical protein